MNNRLLLIISIFTLFSTQARAENNQFEQVLTHFASQPKYLNYCGRDGNSPKVVYKEKGNWQSIKECLTDGRIHLVYANTQDGKHSSYQLERTSAEFVVEFDDADKAILLDSIYEGAQIYVSEQNSKNNDWHIMQCVDAGIVYIGGRKGDASCSVTDRIFTLWAKPKPEYEHDAEYNRFTTYGLREFVHIDTNGEQKNHRKASTWSKQFNWYIRY